ncbi:MAG: BREX-1 system phosphatase PglZ type A, partial [Spirochaetes bacterium]|nr:BREX-1 system phosphatase PglZ type A [Spirochaetota bacterium]
AWALERGEEATAARRNCRVLLHEWRDRYASAEDYSAIATAVEDALQIREAVKSISTDTLAGLYLFPAVDSELANRMVIEVTKPNADREGVGKIARSRIGTYWNRNLQPHIDAIYELVSTFVEFEEVVRTADLSAGKPEELTRRYLEQLYGVDQLYRRCLSAYRRAGSRGSLSEITERLEGRYLYEFLQPLAEAWDAARAGSAVPEGLGVSMQRRFFDTVVAPYLTRGEKLVVIISDALRYEVGRELATRINAVNRLTAETEAMLASAPTITAVGMNALLPHRRLAYTADGGVTIDGTAVNGLEGRSKHLDEEVRKRFPGKHAGAFRANDITQLPSAAARERISGLDLVYLYSNGIDAAADNAKTEESLPDAVDEELRTIEQTVKKFANQLNRSHIIVTADHGFLYQSSPPVDAHMIAAEKPAAGVRERRFLAGGGAPGGHFVSVPASELGFSGADHLHFAEGLYRIRKQGPGSRYVHGGLSLQELLIPLLRVHVQRTDDIKVVEVAVLKPANPVITTPSFSIDFYQTEPVTEKRQGVHLRAYFAAEDGTAISDTVEMDFDSGDPNAQNRTRKADFHFGPSAVAYNGRKVHLKLERLIGGAAVDYAEEAFHYQTFGERDF